MTCDDFKTRLHNLLDERQSPGSDAELLAHAEHCATCRQMLDAVGSITAGLELIDTPVVSPHFNDGVFRRVDKAQKLQNSPSLRAVVKAVLALAALVIMAAVPVWLARPHADDGPAAKNHTAATVPADSPKNRPTQDSESGTSDEPTKLVHDELPASLPSEHYRQLLEGLSKVATSQLPSDDGNIGNESTLQEATAEWIYQVATPLRPLANTMSGAFDGLRETFPGVRPSRQPPQQPETGALSPASAAGAV